MADRWSVFNAPFDDFADCAALMSLMDEIVAVDTAAVHLAGAIGHPSITLLLSSWHSWRWLSPLYDNIRVLRQDTPNDWKSAFAKR
jgi:ADP-heptose:LPS heptosyltransferase